MGKKIFEIDEEMSEIIDAKVGNPQNSSIKSHIWQSQEHENNKITPNNVSLKGLQSLTDVLQHLQIHNVRKLRF